MLITGHWQSGHLTIMGRIRESQYAYLDNNLPLSVHSRGQERDRGDWAKNIPTQLYSLRSPTNHNRVVDLTPKSTKSYF